MKKIPDSWFYLPILILGIYFIIRLVDQSQLMLHFPLDYTNDISSYMAQLFFLDKCGFHTFCPYWYNGFITFQFTPPAWFFFTLPLLKIFGDVKIATYVSMVLIFLLGLVAFLAMGKLFEFSITKRIAFFLFFFGNAIAIGNFIRLGDVHQLFGWMLFVPFAFGILYYKNRKLNKNFYWGVPLLSLIILSHQTIAVLAPFCLLGLFFVKRNGERIQIVLVGIISLILTSFWWIPYIKGFGETIGSQHVLTESLRSLAVSDLPQNLASIFIPLVFWIIFYHYWRLYDKNQKEFIFFLPIIILSILFFFRFVIFIPLLKFVYPDSYLYFFIFFTVFMFLKSEIQIFPLKKLIFLALIFVTTISIMINIFYTPKFMVPDEAGENLIKILGDVDDKFLVIGNKSSVLYAEAIYSYAPIYQLPKDGPF